MEKLVLVIVPFYPKSGARGRQPVPLRIYFMQQWYALSDPAMEDSLYDIESVRRFAGIDFDSDPIPDETTICKFRHLLEAHKLTEKLFIATEGYLGEKGLLMKEGAIVDATIIAASPSTKNKERKRDPEMTQTQKGNQWYFGMKAHIGTDSERGLVHRIAVTKASVHDSQMTDTLLHGKEQSPYGDKAYASEEKRKELEQKGVSWRVSRKASRGKKLRSIDRIWNRHHNQIRAKVEHAFHIIKYLWGYRKVRYKGLEKNAAQVFSLFGLANLFMVRKELVALQG